VARQFPKTCQEQENWIYYKQNPQHHVGQYPYAFAMDQEWEKVAHEKE
jgi:hypothetical protein